MNKKTKAADALEEVITETVTLTHTALGVFQDETTGKWALAKIRYNPTTREAGQVELVTNEEGTKEAVNLRFKITAVNEGLVS